MPQQIQGSQHDFSAGEVDIAFKRADDNPSRKAGVRQCVNFRILNSGAVQNRSGRRALFPEIGRTEKILVTGGVPYFLSFGNGTLKIRDITGAIIASNSGYTWTTATVQSIVYCLVPRAATVTDVVMTFAGQKPQIARFTAGSGWTFLPFAFSIVPYSNEPYFRLSVPGATMQPTTTGGGGNLICSVPYFVAGMVGSIIRYNGLPMIIQSITSPTVALVSIPIGVPLSDQLTLSSIIGVFSVGDIVIDGNGTEAEVANVVGTVMQVNYLNANTRFVAGGNAIVGPNGRAQMTIAASLLPQPTAIWDEEIMSAFAGWPASCFYDQGRLGFTDFPSLPRAIVWSRLGVYDNFLVGPNPTDAMFELVPGNSRVRYVVPGQEGNEFVFCDSKILYIPISVTNPLKPGSVAFNLLSEDGCAAVEPRPSQELIIYVNKGGNSLKAIVASGAYQRPFNTLGLNESHAHLIKNVVAIAAPHADASFQERYVYVLNSDNSLAVGKYDAQLGQLKGNVGWVPFSGAGTLQWIAAQEADIFFTTAYAPNGIAPVSVVEILDDTQYLDCAIPVQSVPAPFVTGGKGPLFAFANGSVALMDQVTRSMGIYQIDANGNIVPQFNGGEDLTAASLVAGQPWTAILEPFAPQAQPGSDMQQRMKMRQISLLAAYVINSSGFILASLFSGKHTLTSPPLGTVMNQRVFPAYNVDDDATLPPTLRETVETFPPPGSSYDPRAALIKDTPGPLQIVEIAMEVSL